MNKTRQWLGMIVTAGIVIAVGQARAQTYTAPPPPNYNDNGPIVYPYYHAQELSVDLFGAGTTGEDHHDHFSDDRWHHAHGGGGVGINYFFCRYVGVGADTLMENLDPFVYSASGNLIGRIPIGDTGLAPYGFVGGGCQFHNDSAGFGQAGAGLEYRFARHVGIFADGRGVFPGEHRNYGLFRAGLRINF